MRIALIDADTLLYKICYHAEQENNFTTHMQALDQWLEVICDRTASDAFVCCLTINAYKRYAIAQSREYKGNRKQREKPKFFFDLRNYMLQKYKALHVDGYEADDVVLALYNKYDREGTDAVIVSNDKDLRQIPARFYDMFKEEHTSIDDYTAHYNLHMQWLHGDSTDNIPGVEGIGPKKAALLLKDKVAEEMTTQVLRAYVNKYGLVDGVMRCAETLQLVKLYSSPDLLDTVEVPLLYSREVFNRQKEETPVTTAPFTGF